MTNTPKTSAQIVEALTEPLPEDADLDSLIHQAVALAREGYVPAPPYPRTVWATRRGNGGPVTEFQNEELARWYFVRMDRRDIKAYGVELVKGTKYSVDWEVVDSIGPVE